MGYHSKELSFSPWEYETKERTVEEVKGVNAIHSQDMDRRAPFEKLPVEIYDQIFSYLISYEPPPQYKRRNSDLSAVLKTSRTLYAATLYTIFQNAMFPHSPVYSKFLAQITSYPVLGSLVRRMDFSQYTSIGLGRTGRMNMEIQNITANTLAQGLRATYNLREFLSHESLGPDFDAGVLEELFLNLPLLEAVDFCGAVTTRFKEAFAEVMHPWNPKLPAAFPIQRLGLHECATLTTSVFTALLPRLPNLTHLDLSHTQVTDSALMSIPETANITHLSLSKCARLSGENVVNFLLEHPATRNLKVLNLHYDSSRYRLLSATDVEDLLPNLPKSLVSLNLTGASITPEHMPLILPLVSRLEELSLGHTELTIECINAIFSPQWKTAIRYLDLTGIAAVTPNALHYSTGALLAQNTTLQILELSEKIVTGCSKLQATKRCGWFEESSGRRSWLVKKTADADDGERDWKMGSKQWGNRKIPCNWGEVGGSYAYYGFKR